MPIEVNRVSLGPLPGRRASGDAEALVIDIRPVEATAAAEPRVHVADLEVTVELVDAGQDPVEVHRRGRRAWSR